MSYLPEKNTFFSLFGLAPKTSFPHSGMRLGEDKEVLPDRRSKVRKSYFRVPYFFEVVRTSAPLLCGDLLGLAASLWAAQALAAYFGMSYGAGTPDLLPVLVVTFVLTFGWFGLYPAVMMKPTAEFEKMMDATSLMFASVYAIMVTADIARLNLGFVLVPAYLFTLAAVPLIRAVVRTVFSRFSWWGHRTLVVGSGKAAEKVFALLKEDTRFGLRPVDVVTNVDQIRKEADLAKEYGVHWVVYAGDRRSCMQSWSAKEMPAKVRNVLVVVPSLVDACGGDLVPPFERADFPEYQIEDRLHSFSHRLVKRVFDFTLAFLSLVVLAPFFFVIAVLMKLTSPGPIFYKHQRIGRHGRKFWVYKFRSMEVNADKKLEDYLKKHPELRKEWEENQKLENDPRIHKVGKFLRKTSIDELPQLWNVLIGNMSIVGPRPIVDDEIKYYGDDFELYKEVCPGITGLWQISGRNKTTYSRRVKLDSFYVRNWCFRLDLYILPRTILVVLLGRGAM